MNNPKVCTLVEIKTTQECFVGNPRDMAFHTRPTDLMHVLRSDECIVGFQTDDIQYRQAQKIGKDKYVLWTPELEEYVGVRLEEIKMLNDALNTESRNLRESHQVIQRLFAEVADLKAVNNYKEEYEDLLESYAEYSDKHKISNYWVVGTVVLTALWFIAGSGLGGV